MTEDVIRRKVEVARARRVDGTPGAERAWRLALARAAEAGAGLPLDVTRLTSARHTLAELLELVPEGALISVVEGPAEGLGIVVLAQPVLVGIIEMLAIGRVTPATPAPRKPTRTDAAMVAETIDMALQDMEASLEEDADLVWAGGFHYASFLDDARPLGLLLEDVTYRVLLAEVSLAGGAKAGSVLLALPADGKGRRPRLRPDRPSPESVEAAFQAALAEQVLQAQADLTAVLHRMTIPLSAVMGFKPGDPVPLPMAALEQIAIEVAGGRRLLEGRLGQNRGMRAVRLSAGQAPVEAAANVMHLRPVAAVDKAG